MTRYWLVQIDRHYVWGLAEHRAGRTNFAPPVDRPGQEPPSEGDLVILWQMGDKDKAGAVACGRFAGPLEKSYLAVNYSEDPYFEGAGTQRLSRRIEFTHWFHATDKVTRTVLRKDPRFAEFALFKTGGAQGMNPWPLTAEQHQAILERMPPWALLTTPDVEFVVELALPTKQLDREGAAKELRSRLATAAAGDLRVDVVRADGTERDVDEFVQDFTQQPADDATLITYAVTSWGRTAYEAAVDALEELVGDPALIVDDGCDLLSVAQYFNGGSA